MKEQNEESVNNSLKVGLIIAAVLLVGGSIIFGTIYKRKQDVIKAIENEKKLLVKDLSDLQLEYQEVVKSSDDLSEQLDIARQDISSYIDSLSEARLRLASIGRLRKQLFVLKEERKRLLLMNDSLFRSNRVLVMQRDSVIFLLKNQRRRIMDSLSSRKPPKKKKPVVLDNFSTPKVESFSVTAIKQKGRGTLKTVNKARQTDRLRICYKVSKSPDIVNTKNKKTEEIKYYILVLDPSGVSLGVNKTASNNKGKNISYTQMSAFQYTFTDLNVCDYAWTSKFKKGSYTVSLYNNKLELEKTSKIVLK